MDERPALGRAPRFQLGSGGQVRAPCPFAIFIADDFEPRIAVSFLGDPKLCRSDGLRQMQQLVLPPKSRSTRTCPGFGSSATSKTRALSAEWLRMMVTRITPSEEKLPSCSVNDAGAVQVG
jgi:hypothetical protein